MKEEDFGLVEGSGNVFRDLGDPHADLKQAKAIVAARIIAVLDERALTVRKAEELTGFAAADFSRIRNASLGRLTRELLSERGFLPRSTVASGSRSRWNRSGPGRPLPHTELKETITKNIERKGRWPSSAPRPRRRLSGPETAGTANAWMFR